MNALVVLRLLDTYFRHRWLYLVPVALIGAAGAWTVASGEDSYRSVATMKVERAALVTQLTGTEQDPGFGWDTPAGATAESLNSLLRTETFVDDVAVAAELDEMLDVGLMTSDDLRASIAVYPDGVRLIKIVGSNESPDVAHRIANATIESYIDTVMANEMSDSVVAVDFLEQKLPDYEAGVAEAEEALRLWFAEHPEPSGDRSRPANDEVELQRLQDAVSTQDGQLTQAESNVEQAQLSVEQKGAEVQQRLAVIDPPQVPLAPEPRFKVAVMTVAMALLVGGLLSLAGVVIATTLDRTVRFPGDVQQRLGTSVLAVVPRARMSAAMRKQLADSAVGSSARVRAQTDRSVADLPWSDATESVDMSLVDRADSPPGEHQRPALDHRGDVNGVEAAVALERVR